MGRVDGAPPMGPPGGATGESPRGRRPGGTGAAPSPTTRALWSEDVFLPGPAGRFERKAAAVVLREGLIAEVIPGPPPRELEDLLERVDGLVIPGAVEVQTNGSYGVDIAVDPDAIACLRRRLPEQGVTTFFPTVISSPEEVYARVFSQVDEASGGAGAEVGGVHAEGPMLARPGAHRPEHLRPASLELAARLVEMGEGKLRILTLAPELPGALEVIRYCAQRGVLVSAGHTDAQREDLLAAFESGVTLVTHLTNAMSKGLGPEDPVSALRDFAGVRSGIIVDGIHVKEALLRELYQRLGPERLFLVTDASAPAGMPDGEYTLGEARVLKSGDTVRLAEAQGTLAGSALTMDAALRNAVTLLGVPLEDAVLMATRTAALAAGLADRGEISPGKRADLVVLDRVDLTVRETLVGGVTQFQAKGTTSKPGRPT